MNKSSQWTIAILNVLAAMNAYVLTKRLREVQEQAWFWTPTWLAGELEADEEIAAGHVVRHLDHDDFVESLMKEVDLTGEQDGRPFITAIS